MTRFGDLYVCPNDCGSSFLTTSYYYNATCHICEAEYVWANDEKKLEWLRGQLANHEKSMMRMLDEVERLLTKMKVEGKDVEWES